jgi:AcrR family transcriptional regulator
MDEHQAPLAPRKRPKQSRSEATYAVILEAAARILEEGKGTSFTTNHVAEKAGVSVGSLYQYFSCKEEILAALIRNMRSEMLEDIAAAASLSAGECLADAATTLINASVKHHLARPNLSMVLERAEAGLPFDAETRQLKLRMVGIVSAMLASRNVPGPEQAARDAIAISHGLAEAAMQRGEADAGDLAKRMRRAVLGYLDALIHEHSASTSQQAVFIR